ncbi:MAG TPA: carboxypeptidase M32 [Solirubrobacteraceae bacterium]|jgi:carboxypeptidase Taq|nr:carboxypeptidase M32 [Solirubrobacteraceae bacterium]
MTEIVTELRRHLGELTDLRNTVQLLQWDQQTMMPPRGAELRADELGTVQRILHQSFVSAQTGRLLDDAEDECATVPPDSDEARLISVVRRRWEKARRVPSELAAEMARAASTGQEAWVGARAHSDFAGFLPHLRRGLELKHRYIECFDGYGYDNAYDVLLDDFEPGLGSAEVALLFAELKAELVPLIAEVSERGDAVDDSCLHGTFPIAGQRRLVTDVVARMGFEPAGWRLDDTVHPFATSLGSTDVRITTRWDESFLPMGLFGAMHECGHGLYEAGIAPSLRRTPLGSGEALGLHESQSRLWENMVGRGRPFADYVAPRIAEIFGASRSGPDPEGFYRAVNRVHPTFIRVEADEATYGLHIILRFELEQELIEGRIAVEDLPEVWNERFREYFGLDVPDDARGVLQDVHWAAGLIGYFPTYAIGNLVAGQLWRRLRDDLPDLDAQISAGDLTELREWLREHVHRHGSKWGANEVLERVTGAPITVAPFIDYLKGKLSGVYGV